MKLDAFMAQSSHNLSTVAHQQNALGNTSGTQDAATPQTSTSGCSPQSSSSGVASQSPTTPTTTNTNTSVQDGSSSQWNTLGTTQGISTQQTSSSGSSRQSISHFLESISKSNTTSTEMVTPNTECKAPYQKATKVVVTSGVIPPQSCPERNRSVNNVLESFMEECTASSLPSSQLTPKPKSHGRKRRAKNTPNNNNIVRRSPRIAAKKARTEI